MNDYDEYQRFIRYRNGYQAFCLISVLVFLSFMLTLFNGGEWAESKTVEYIVILLIPSGYLNIRNTWNGAYYGQKDNALIYNIIFFLTGLMYLWLFGFDSSANGNMIEDGKVTLRAVQFFMGILWMGIPTTYFIRHYIDRRKGE